MIVSPCTLRSAQCAALIALAAAAGIARIDVSTCKSAISEPSPTANASRASRPASARISAFGAALLLHPTARTLPSLSESLGPRDGPTILESSIFPPSALPLRANLAPTSLEGITLAIGVLRSYPLTHWVARCGRPRLLPFAVGPPVRSRLNPLNADGTIVPGDSAAVRPFGLKVAAFDEASSAARLARLFRPSLPPAGPYLPTRGAPRGSPWAPTHRSRDAVGAAGNIFHV